MAFRNVTFHILKCLLSEAGVFSVDIEYHTYVEALQEAIVNKKKHVNDRFQVDSATLTLYLARKKQDEKTTWLKSDFTLKPFLKRGKQDDKQYMKMPSSLVLDDDYFGEELGIVIITGSLKKG
ncbi:unnamed protein product [Phytophthora lilii]|uniref:Unnamed protein product n=1 Tax=Phytophthora lilii TaxID=2077276 RepID=A0A9W6TBA0_9STRA|nr:unnamed protein product [Phytophthora lilii]